jgi:(p)ppGpp synthase/HD superfamily hydrolase
LIHLASFGRIAPIKTQNDEISRFKPLTLRDATASSRKELPMRDILLISRAWNFAAQRHSIQRRKGKAQEPYVNHLAEVAELVATATEGQDANLVAAAVLHDTVEDTATLAG